MDALFVTIENNGQSLVSTNYWTTELASNGMFYLSFNAGAGRLLVPRNQEHYLSDMLMAKRVVIRHGQSSKGMLWELEFDDESDNPFVLHLSDGQVDRTFSCNGQSETMPFYVITESGLDAEKVATIDDSTLNFA